MITPATAPRTPPHRPSGRGEAVLRPARLLAVAAATIALSSCQSTGETRPDHPPIPAESRALEKQLDAEATALGTAQALASMPAAWDPTGAASLVTTTAGLAAREAFRRRADALLDAQAAKDRAALYRQYGLNPDGSPSGRKGPLSTD
ncbi:hypothetical protein [Bosea minatitlanensis]|uniref:Uncharacterized protein n=1 Tax=Bosea minatitlanensis TaxID=128782 RepID=A0ABW0F7P4_9HYPH|nr:hypothetical protein [Bosea minatitlanensis]MCT4496118.1 hypothetical protein [Bosea minatitlanensis]